MFNKRNNCYNCYIFLPNDEEYIFLRIQSILFLIPYVRIYALSAIFAAAFLQKYFFRFLFIGVCFASSINVGCMKGSKSSIKCFILIQLLGFVQSCRTVHSRDVCVPFLFLQTVTRQLFTDCFELD